jgi:hypothetical protein
MVLLKWLIMPLLITAVMAPPVSAGTARGSLGFTKASDLIGQDVENSAGDDLGELDDILIDRNGQAVFGLVDGKKYVPVPWRAFQMNKDGDLTLNINGDRLRGAPSIDEDNWSKLNDPEFALGVFDFYGVEPPPQVARGTRDTDMFRLTKRIQGDVLAISEDMLVIKETSGRETALHFDEGTKMPRTLSEGDRITARITQDRYAEVIKRVR